ncbi:unnamed protein product [Adineta steineri]|uniref:Uncharacterized protein n=1 Tax=Adineta steineri TaxID=433720 RepID=A0A814SN85_9BILA|nr:unnamed protein product [Adineta steineri]
MVSASRNLSDSLLPTLTISFVSGYYYQVSATFLVQPFFADFLLEILISTSSREVRQCALRNIIRLCKIETSACDIRAVIHQILLKARLPLWSTSSAGTRGPNQKLLAQSIEYFDLRCQLTENLTKEMQKMLHIDAQQILTDEFNWLSTYTVSSTSNELRAIDNILFMGKKERYG